MGVAGLVGTELGGTELGWADDAEVVARSLERPEAFARLYDRHAPDIHRYVARRLGDSMADDITADTFLTAFRIRARYDRAHPNARPWLYGIAGNLIGRHRRTEVRALKALARTGHDPVAASWSETWVERTDSRVAAQGPLAGALAALSAGDRHVLLLVAWADLGYQEVAQALDIPVGTVRSRLNRARRKVRAALGADPAFAGDDPAYAGDTAEVV
ncbi:sigma-70 family RNA polymerase sigma factor [Streptomyces caniscabiei]|uniref:RNA polymerase sigma factor n=1 Tax=Streptomyces caniscabiei TaxID=2746961 RepID=UPI0029B331DF|nr:sigma-70 family RNA polymerase sigma factor [Streptomyces caniscabiei]MDX2605200.1 sigma-70 family RNA polymerase sigma factor [Streptomyces caniscabiei]MDX2738358.1 sigma-70 family RNA polymerase sigma factor [Streptomyces caniscabiei]MDX2778950.1 sigma-70 family RNA polymerase sigma factor [Streptomyces caniscabiei]